VWLGIKLLAGVNKTRRPPFRYESIWWLIVLPYRHSRGALEEAIIVGPGVTSFGESNVSLRCLLDIDVIESMKGRTES